LRTSSSCASWSSIFCWRNTDARAAARWKISYATDLGILKAWAIFRKLTLPAAGSATTAPRQLSGSSFHDHRLARSVFQLLTAKTYWHGTLQQLEPCAPCAYLKRLNRTKKKTPTIETKKNERQLKNGQQRPGTHKRNEGEVNENDRTNEPPLTSWSEESAPCTDRTRTRTRTETVRLREFPVT
jgi:hypothetical protein